MMLMLVHYYDASCSSHGPWVHSYLLQCCVLQPCISLKLF